MFWMSWQIRLTRQAEHDLKHWRKHDRATFEKCVELLNQLETDPTNLETTGHPEWLKGDLAGCMSRRINQTDRCVYEVLDGVKVIRVLQLRFHYDDR
jgi:toxin YoeB